MHVHTVLVANTKGGCGKTTIATHLAAAFAAAGFRTALADGDRQRSALGWLDARPDDLPAIRGLDWTKDTDDPPKGTARLVVDIPAAMKMKAMDDLIRNADVVLLPVLPSGFDEAATSRFVERLDGLKPVRKQKVPIAVVANRVRARSKAADRLDRFLEGLGHKAAASLRDSVVYADLASEGRSVFDLPGKRHEALKDDWRPLLAHVEAQF